MTTSVTSADIAQWIARQYTVAEPNDQYIAWLQIQFRLKCQAEVLPGIERHKLNSESLHLLSTQSLDQV